MEATLDVWEIPAESATRVGHPAPFPVALVERCIQLFTYDGDVVLDPFMGSGTTAVAAVNTGRHYIGYDTDAGYVRQARERVESMVPEARRDRRTLKEMARNAARRSRLHRCRRGRSHRSRRHGELPGDEPDGRRAPVRARRHAHAGASGAQPGSTRCGV